MWSINCSHTLTSAAGLAGPTSGSAGHSDQAAGTGRRQWSHSGSDGSSDADTTVSTTVETTEVTDSTGSFGGLYVDFPG